jgi:hypothetical protein
MCILFHSVNINMCIFYFDGDLYKSGGTPIGLKRLVVSASVARCLRALRPTGSHLVRNQFGRIVYY